MAGISLKYLHCINRKNLNIFWFGESIFCMKRAKSPSEDRNKTCNRNACHKRHWHWTWIEISNTAVKMQIQKKENKTTAKYNFANVSNIYLVFDINIAKMYFTCEIRVVLFLFWFRKCVENNLCPSPKHT